MRVSYGGCSPTVFSRRMSAWYAVEGVAFLISCTKLLKHSQIHESQQDLE